MPVSMKKFVFSIFLFMLSFSGFPQSFNRGFSDAPNKVTGLPGVNKMKKGYYSTIQVSLMMGDIQLTDRSVRYMVSQEKYSSVIAPDFISNYTRSKMIVLPSVSVTSGFKINKHWSAGAGVGFEIFDSFLFPLFGEFRYTLSKKRISPFATLKGGYAFGNFGIKHVDDLYLNWPPYYIQNAGTRHDGGVMLNPEMGIKLPMDENNDLLITAAFRYQEKKSVVRKDYENGQFEEWEHREYLNRLSIGVAILF
jgi:hypothetical protein